MKDWRSKEIDLGRREVIFWEHRNLKKKSWFKKKKKPQGTIKGVENHSFSGYNKSHQIYCGEHPQIPTLPGNLFTLSQSVHQVIIGIKE